jgi:hypothetical protein
MKFLFLAAAVLAFTACQNDPYGGKTPVDGAPPPKTEKPKELPGVQYLVHDGYMKFTEGRKGEYLIQSSVKGTGTPVIELRNGPSDVTYDPASKKLIWTPDYAAANDPQDPNILVRTYTIDVVMSSSDDLSSELDRHQVVLEVVDMPIPASIISNLTMKGQEGQLVSHLIEFKDEEYPKGPFEIAMSGFPSGTNLIWPDRGIPKFTLEWTPSLTDVKGDKEVTFSGHIVLYSPRGRRLQFSVLWQIMPVATAPVTGGPTSVIQGMGDIDFIVWAEDPNGEKAPKWTVKKAPPYGSFAVTDQAVTAPGLPRTMGIAAWKLIPPDKLGIPVTVELEACVSWSLCTVYKAQLLPIKAPPNHGGRP